MRTAILTILFIVLAECAALGQTVLPPVYEIKSDTDYVQKISTEFYQMLEDKSGKVTILDVTSLPLSDQFHIRNDKSSTRDTISNTYWFRYRFKNVMNREARVTLNASSEYVDFYLTEPDGKWKHFITGGFIDWNKKDGIKLLNCIPLVLQPEEERTVYQRIQNDAVGLDSDFDISISSTEKMIQIDSKTKYFSKTHLQEAFVVGFLFLAVFFNLFFFRIVREKVYLYFALFVLFLCINRLYNISWEFFKIEDAGLLRYVYYLRYAWVFIVFFLIQFFRQFFQTKARFHRWDKWLIGLAILNIFLFVIRFVSEVYFKKANSSLPLSTGIVAFVFVPLSVMVTLLLYARRSDKSIRLVIIGSFPLMLFYLLSSRYEVAKLFSIELGFLPFFEIFQHQFRLLEISCISWMVISFSWILFMRYDRLNKENAQHALDKEKLAKEKEIEKNELVELQKIELEKQVVERTADLKQSLEDLKSTQSQLIQSEKMASLGELTAGIAHEIQNPLNFVNNFSEVNKELLAEMREEIANGNYEEVNALAKNIEDNEEKINQHGKRADRIVKGMLQHSRNNSGVKEPVNINALADEYFRLAYHGLRAKDKSFNASMKTDFDPNIGPVNVIPQDIGSVILNLITNAFYAVTEKRDQSPVGYEPVVSVSTKKLEGKVEIKVADNGNGIPQKVLDKIFQPFFTTKPAGQGTGLGLSLCYDIITKGHGGTIEVESKEGEGTAMIVILPI